MWQDGQEPDHDVVPDRVDLTAADVLVELIKQERVFRLASEDELVVACADEKVSCPVGELSCQKGVQDWVS